MPEIIQNGLSQIAIDRVKQLDELKFRKELREEHIERYRLAYERGADMPPVKVFDVAGMGYLLVDGFHRIEAAKRAGLKAIKADITPGTFDQAKEVAILANRDHGIPWTREEKRNIIAAYLKLHPERADRWIAEELRVDTKTVQKIREQLESGVEIPHLDKLKGRDGKWYSRTVQRSSQRDRELSAQKPKVELEVSNLDENDPSEVAQRAKNILDYAEKHGEVIQDDFAEDNKKTYSEIPKKKGLYKVEDPPTKRRPLGGYTLEPSKEQEGEELHQDKIMDLVNEGCEPVDPSKIKDIGESEERYELAKAFAQFINLTFEEMEWEDDVYEDFFELEDGRVFHVIIKERRVSSKDKDIEDDSWLDLDTDEEMEEEEVF